MIKIGFIGLGWAAQNLWHPAFTANEKVEIVAGSDPSRAARQKFSDFADAKNIYSDPKKIFGHSPDLCVIATPNNHHGKMAKLALSHNVHVLIEKPVCTNMKDWREINALAKQRGLKIFTSHAVRFRRDISLLVEKIDDKTVGEIRTVELEWIRAKGIPNAASWFTNKKKAGGGVFIDLGWHLADLCLHIIKPQTIEFVSGFSTNDFIGDKDFEADWKNGSHNIRDRNLKASVEDNATCYLNLDKISVRIKTAWASHGKKDITRILITGSHGELELKTLFGFSNNGPEVPVLIIRQKGREKFISIPYEKRGIEYQRQAEEILKEISMNNSVYEKNHIVDDIIPLFTSFYKKTRV